MLYTFIISRTFARGRACRERVGGCDEVVMWWLIRGVRIRGGSRILFVLIRLITIDAHCNRCIFCFSIFICIFVPAVLSLRDT